VLSTISRRDDIQYGKSYYYVEIETILEFITAADTHVRYLFLIDEILRGTNTVERLAASSSVLKYLGERGLVLVTTHDIELEYMLDEKYRMFHFQEQIKDNRHFFDYKINSGSCRSRNAIKLLELTGYPVEVTSEAHEIALMLNKATQ
jgi:DNA mismatch repair ATPase MutS